MQIIDIYGKEYTCGKCKAKVNYGAASTDGKTPVTKNGKPFNNKFGKDSNKLSVAVNAGTRDIHPCYASYVKKDYDSLTGDAQEAKGSTPLTQDNIKDFEIEWNKAYQRLSGLASKVSPDPSTARDKHICLCGILHDYFNYIK